jgi:hypothetical protein
MFQNTIISNELSIYKFFKHLNFDFYLTKPQLRHLENIMNAMISKGYNGKISDIAELAPSRHRTAKHVFRTLYSKEWYKTVGFNELALDFASHMSYRESTQKLNYAMRKSLGLRNSSNKAEKSNDILVASRQKHNGMSWSKEGSVALSTISTLYKNNEQTNWYERGKIEFKFVV